MRTVVFVLAIVTLTVSIPAGVRSQGAPQAGRSGALRTMRVDYYHTGNDKEERFSLDRILIEPLPWPGNPAVRVDRSNSGKYFFEVADAASGEVLYSRGFASVYGEWETTGEAREMNRTFSESLRFPAVEKPAKVVLKKRDAKNVFQEIWTFTLDPASKFVERGARMPSAGPLIKFREAGDPADKLDLLVMGDGYTAAERGKFERDAKRLLALLFETSPFKERQNDINVWGLVPASAESGISRPSQGIHHRSPLGTTYDAFDSERYILTFENRAFRDYASNAPYDVVEILTNSKTYGGGGIFNLYSTVAADSEWAPYVFVHEFGHHIAGLADEYYTSDVAYLPSTTRIEPWEPNATALLDPASLKWKDLVEAGTPLPTPWAKDEYEKASLAGQEERRKIRAGNRSETEMDALFRRELVRDTELLGRPPYAGRIGAFEGANYEARGYYRPQSDCIMFTRDKVPFCRVCQRAIGQILDMHVRR